MQSGVTALQTLEAKAGMDLLELKVKHGDEPAFISNVDLRKISEPLETLKKSSFPRSVGAEGGGGGHILNSDHSIPPSVSLDNYQCLLKLNEKCGRYGVCLLLPVDKIRSLYDQLRTRLIEDAEASKVCFSREQMDLIVCV